jgi:hypothetical protein
VSTHERASQPSLTVPPWVQVYHFWQLAGGSAEAVVRAGRRGSLAVSVPIVFSVPLVIRGEPVQSDSAPASAPVALGAPAVDAGAIGLATPDSHRSEGSVPSAAFLSRGRRTSVTGGDAMVVVDDEGMSSP